MNAQQPDRRAPFRFLIALLSFSLLIVGLASISPAGADNVRDDNSPLVFSWQSSGAWRGIEANHDHNKYSHDITGDTVFRRDFHVWSKFKDERRFKSDVETGWLWKATCRPNANHFVNCDVNGTMGDRWDEQRLFYRSVDGCCPNNKRVEMDGEVDFRWHN